MITKQIEFNIPEDKEVQSALGVLVVRHGHLEYLLRLTVKSLLQLPIHEALTQTNKKGVKALREKIEKEAKERLRQGIALDKLLDFLKRSWEASDKRNIFVHNLWASERGGPLMIQNDDFSWSRPPSSREIEDLSRKIQTITHELNKDRKNGDLSEALKNLSLNAE